GAPELQEHAVGELRTHRGGGGGRTADAGRARIRGPRRTAAGRRGGGHLPRGPRRAVCRDRGTSRTGAVLAGCTGIHGCAGATLAVRTGDRGRAGGVRRGGGRRLSDDVRGDGSA